MSETSSPRPAGSGKSGSSGPSTFVQARMVRRYLCALEASKQGKGPKRTSDAVGNRITKIDELLVSADPLTRVHLTQERLELHAEHVRLSNGNHGEMAQLERDFIRVARSYGDRNGLTYAAWRQVGVDSKVLDRARIRRAEKKPPPAAVKAAAERAATAEEAPASAPEQERGNDQAPEGAASSSADAPPPPAAATPPATEQPASPTPAVASPSAGDPVSTPAADAETRGSPAGNASAFASNPAASSDEPAKPGVEDEQWWPVPGSAEPGRSPSPLFPDDEAGPRG